jgi:2-hydroxyacyl-CoA lyase 1
MQKQTTANDTKADIPEGNAAKARKGLRSTSLLYETRYEKMADMVGGRGWFIRTEAELAEATRAAFLEREKVCVLNVIIDPGLNSAAQFGWMDQQEKHAGGGESKL